MKHFFATNGEFWSLLLEEQKKIERKQTDEIIELIRIK